MGQVEDEFHFLCLCTNYSDLREVLYIKAARVFPAFSELDELEKFVYLLNNLQRHVIIYLNDAIYRRRSSLFNSWMYLNDSHAYVIYCFLNVSVTYKPNGAGWFCLILSVYMIYMYITCHVNKDYVMLCYAMLCYVMLCYVMYPIGDVNHEFTGCYATVDAQATYVTFGRPFRKKGEWVFVLSITFVARTLQMISVALTAIMRYLPVV